MRPEDHVHLVGPFLALTRNRFGVWRGRRHCAAAYPEDVPTIAVRALAFVLSGAVLFGSREGSDLTCQVLELLFDVDIPVRVIFDN